MKPDPLRIEFRKIGGAFSETLNGGFVSEIWGCMLCHAGGLQQEFVLAVGTKESMFEDGIARLEGILARLKDANQQAKSNDT